MSVVVSPAGFDAEVVDEIVGAQAENGAFRSYVICRGRVREDWNGCITGLVIRAIGHGRQPPRLHAARERGLGYLERCERPAAPGTFGFWPERERPEWAPQLPADTDDTAIIALELFRARRRSLDWLRRVALLDLLRVRVRAEEGDPGWVRPGVFRTWLTDVRPNPVDCVVNVNVAALLAAAGLTGIAAYRAVGSMLAAALDSADDARQVARLSPFYADPIELRWALAHAVASGAHDLQPSLDRLGSLLGEAIGSDADRPVCCSAYGLWCWSAPILQFVRAVQWGALRTR
jgi:hypothetical protein